MSDMMKTLLALALLPMCAMAEPLPACKPVLGGGELFPNVGEACLSKSGQVLVTSEKPAMEKVRESLTPEEYKQRTAILPKRVSVSDTPKWQVPVIDRNWKEINIPPCKGEPKKGELCRTTNGLNGNGMDLYLLEGKPGSDMGKGRCIETKDERCASETTCNTVINGHCIKPRDLNQWIDK